MWQTGPNGEAVTKVVDTRASLLRVADTSLIEQSIDAVAQTGSGVRTPTPRVVAQKRCGWSSVAAECEAPPQIAAQLPVRTCRQRHEARLVELRLTHPDDAGLTIDIGERQTQHFAAAQPGRVEEHNRQAQDHRA